MKKLVAGGFLSLVGSIWALVILFVAGNNLVSSWDTDLGRFWATVSAMKLTFLFVLAVIVTLSGSALMAFELFRKEQ